MDVIGAGVAAKAFSVKTQHKRASEIANIVIIHLLGITPHVSLVFIITCLTLL